METESAVYIKDGHLPNGEPVDFISAILDGVKTGETRRHNRLARGWVGVAKDGFVYGRVLLGEPYPIQKDSPEYAAALIEGTEYDITPGKRTYFYHIVRIEDFRSDPKPVLRGGHYALYRRN